MSGIVGIFQRDGAPVAPEQLRTLVARQRYIAPGAGSNSQPPEQPDSQNIWCDGPIGLHQVPWPSGAAPSEPGSRDCAESLDPATAHLHIAADVRFDSREQLRAELSHAGRQVSPSAGDAELLLHAYAHWGSNCVEHLRGDFAFAVWDAHSRKLFCARDHFGIKPFYYALFDSLFLFSNSLNSLRRHPRVSAELNDSAVADFLLFGLNCDNSTTTFRDIQRLPPAHALLVSSDAVQLRRYWDVPATGRIRYALASDYVENFLSVWDSAVADRLDAFATGVLLSGGLDSATVAATAKNHVPAQNVAALRAFTLTYQNLAADRDPYFAAALAQALGIPFEAIAVTELHPFEHWDALPPIAPEPVDDPLFAALPLSFQKIAAHCRVLLSGEGSDNLMHFQMWPYAADLRSRGEWSRLVRELLQFAWRRPFPWRGLRVRAQRLWGRGESSAQTFPKWIDPDFAARHNLRARWRAGQRLPVPPHGHPIHPVAHASLYLPQWTRLFELQSPGVTNTPIEVRYPFLDLRVVEYLLAIPPFPWFFQKFLLRQAMAGRVPDPVRLRPKAAFAAHLVLENLRRSGPFATIYASKGLDPAGSHSARLSFGEEDPRGLRRAELFGRYINSSLLAPLHAKMTVEQVSQNARPFCFNFWLQSIE